MFSITIQWLLRVSFSQPYQDIFYDSFYLNHEFIRLREVHLHVTPNRGDGNYPHFTQHEGKPWSFYRNEVIIVTMGNLRDSTHLFNPMLIPAYVMKYDGSIYNYV